MRIPAETLGSRWSLKAANLVQRWEIWAKLFCAARKFGPMANLSKTRWVWESPKFKEDNFILQFYPMASFFSSNKMVLSNAFLTICEKRFSMLKVWKRPVVSLQSVHSVTSMCACICSNLLLASRPDMMERWVGSRISNYHCTQVEVLAQCTLIQCACALALVTLVLNIWDLFSFVVNPL